MLSEAQPLPYRIEMSDALDARFEELIRLLQTMLERGRPSTKRSSGDPTGSSSYGRNRDAGAQPKV
jgi:hypothetical protein